MSNTQNAVAVGILAERLAREMRIAVKYGMFRDDNIAVEAVLAEIVGRPEFNEVKNHIIQTAAQGVYGEVLMISWCVEDVLIRAGDLGVTLNHDDALKVLHGLDDSHDANLGIDWDLMDDAIKAVWMEKQGEQKMNKGGCDE